MLPTHRKESIFDSNAITATVVLGHIFNLLRMREIPIETSFVTTYTNGSMGLTRLGNVVQMTYCLAGIYAILDINLSHLIHGGCVQLWSNNHNLHITLMIHTALLGSMVYVHVNLDGMSQINTIIRSITFVSLSILWSYIVGVKHIVQTLWSREHIKENRSNSVIVHALVQQVVFCHIRFGIILVMDAQYMPVWITLALFVTIARGYVACTTPTYLDETHQVCEV